MIVTAKDLVTIKNEGKISNRVAKSLEYVPCKHMAPGSRPGNATYYSHHVTFCMQRENKKALNGRFLAL